MSATKSDNGGPLERMVVLLAELQSHESALMTVRQRTHVKVGGIMRELRQRSGLSLRETARRLKCSVPFLASMELGRRGQSIEWMRKLSAVTTQPDHFPDVRKMVSVV